MEELLDYRRGLLERLANIAGDYQAALSATEGGQGGRGARLATPAEQRACIHARDVSKEIFLPGQEALLAGESPERLDIVDAPGVAASRPEEPLEAVLAELQALCTQQAARLEDLPPQAWNATWRHPKVGQRTLLWWVERSLLHLQAHLPHGSLRPLSSDSPTPL
ncbi:MAG: hypothetical protein PHD58_04670 [Anaerolineales bacterium]|nr:hypothetical protein [Anaerolineales bacterium]